MYRLRLINLVNRLHANHNTFRINKCAFNSLHNTEVASLSISQNIQRVRYLTSHSKHVRHENICETKQDLSESQAINTSEANHLSEDNHLTEHSHLTEEQFLVKVKNDPDTFGRAAEAPEILYEEDIKEQEYLERPPSGKRLSTKKYADIIKRYIRQKKIKEAIDVLEVRMLKEDGVKPENYIYNLLLGACGRVGYTKKAFSLYNQMKKRGLSVHPGAYTALFNACANSPWPEDGLSRARHLRELIFEKQVELNDTNYNAMIKAFGRCGDLPTAFSLVDEMFTKKFRIQDSTLNFLLQACINDEEAGFRHALLVWRKFMLKRIQPSIYSYNLMLRCIRDCGLGNVEATNDVINKILSAANQPVRLRISEGHKLISSESSKLEVEINDGLAGETKADEMLSKSEIHEKSSNEKDRSKSHENLNFTKDEGEREQAERRLKQSLQKYDTPESLKSIIENRPNLLARKPYLGDLIEISEVTKPEDRLMLVGGMIGFLQNMAENKIIPDIKTYTQLLDTIPNSRPAELELLKTMKKNELQPDIDFYNMLIKKRAMRFDFEGAKEGLRMLKDAGYKPNLITYGVLALGCKTPDDARELLEEMQEGKYRLNIEILGAMMYQACHHSNFSYVLELMKICKDEEIKPNQKFMEHLEEFKKKCKQFSNDKDKNKTVGFQKGFGIFRMRYKSFRDEMLPFVEEETHPWQQFRQTSDTDVRHFKDKDVRFKPRHLSKFRQKAPVEIVKKPHKWWKFKKDGKPRTKELENV